MTRMSINRFERKTREKKAAEALKKNTCWDDLNQVSAAANELMQRHLVIAGMMRNKELCSFLVDAQSVASNGKLLAKDITILAHELQALSALHAGKTGGTDDPDVVMHTIGIYEQYQLFLERHEAVVMPTIGAILEQFHIAEERLNVAYAAGLEAAKEQAEDQANDISEGEFVEVSNEIQPGLEHDEEAFQKSLNDGAVTITPQLRQTNIGEAGEARYEVVPKDKTSARGQTETCTHVDESPFQEVK